MIKKVSGIELLKRNFDSVELKFLDFFEKGEPRWPMDKRDYLRNHHQSLDQFFPATVSMDKLRLTGLPDEILVELRTAFEAFQRGEEYN
jgi:hypothetical protein